MEEIVLKDNPLGVKVYINGRVSIENMPKEDFDLFVSAIESMINEHYEEIAKSKQGGE